MFYCLSIIWILSFSGLLTIFFKRKFELVATISILLGALIMYPFGYINHLSWGFYLSWIFVVLFLGILIKWIIKKDNEKLKEFKDNYFTVGLVFFLIVLVYFFFRYKLQGFSNCDEFTHWGVMIKETLRLDGFYTQDASKLIMHKDYPPFFTLLEVLFMGFNGFNYSETIAYISLETFMFSCLIPVYSNLDIKKKSSLIKGIIITISMLLIGITIDNTSTASDYAFVYNSIYVDWALASFATYGIYMTYKESDWGLFKFTFLTLTCVCFILMKQMGLVFWLIILMYAFIKVLFVDRRLNRRMLLKGIIFLIVIPLFAYFSWRYVVNKYEVYQQFKISNFSIKEFVNIALGNTDLTWKHEAFYNFILNIVRRPLKLHPFNMSYFVYVMLLAAIIVLAFWFKKEGNFVAITYFIGACGYAIAMLLLYTLFFTIDEAPYLNSFDRYMCSYLYFGTSLTFVLVIECIHENLLKICASLAVLLLFVEFDNIDQLYIKRDINATPNATVVVVDQWLDNFAYSREDLNGYRMNFIVLKYIDDANNLEEFKNTLDEVDGLYINSFDPYLEDYINEIGTIDVLYNEEFYLIEKGNENNYRFIDAPYDLMAYVLRYYSMGI